MSEPLDDRYERYIDPIDAATHADRAMLVLSGIVGTLTERRRGYIRDELQEAFIEGRHQERLRVIRIASIARDRAATAEARALAEQIIKMLRPELEGTE